MEPDDSAELEEVATEEEAGADSQEEEDDDFFFLEGPNMFDFGGDVEAGEVRVWKCGREFSSLSLLLCLS